MKNKKGSHVGMVLSFSMFIVFLIFVYSIVGSPINSEKRNENVFKEIQEVVIKNVSDLVYTSRIFDEDNVGECINISNPENDFSIPVVIVKDESNEIASKISGGITSLEGGAGFVKAYYSDNFFENGGTFSGTGCVDVEIDSVSNEERILEKKIILLLNELKENYSIIKNDFGIDNNVDFHLQFEYENGTILESGKFQELKREVFAKNIPINYLDIYANEKKGSLIVKTW